VSAPDRLPPGERAAVIALSATPWVVTVAWTAWILGCIDRIEAQVRPLSGLAYATFVQLAYDWSTGAGWVQTVHRGYADEWRWGGHFTPLLFVTSWLASFSSSPWALARVQAVAVGLGCLAAWKLGRDEAGRLGGLLGLLLYAGSGSVALLALADYQDMVLVLPILPLAVWAARQAPAWVFVVIAALLGAVREETVLLLPLVGLAGGVNRAVLGTAVAAGYLGVYGSMPPPGYPNPLRDILTFQVHAAQGRGLAFPSFAPNLYGLMAGAGWPWAVFAPVVALPAVATAVFHAQDPTAVGSISSPAIHHLAPLTAGAITAGIVGASRLLRLGRVPAVIVFVAAIVTTVVSAMSWAGPLARYGLRDWHTGTHPVWALLADVDPDAVLLVPQEVAPAAARRRRVVTLDSVGDRVRASDVHLAIDDGHLVGTVIRTEGSWRLLADPVLPTVTRREATGHPQ
jgi:hypothetical protein